MRVWLSLIVVALIVTSCSMSQSIVPKVSQVRAGMTQEDVVRLIGRTPDKRNFNLGVEEWIYYTYYFGSVSNVYKIGFEDGRVVSFDDGSARSVSSSSPVETHSKPVVVLNEPQMPRDNWLSRLEKQLNSGFSSERMPTLKRVLSGRYITVQEAKMVVKFFPFQSEKWEALKICIPAIVDFEDLTPLFELFPFSSDRRQIEQWVNKEVERRIASRSIVY